MIENNYIIKLINCLEHTKFCSENNELTYTQGMEVFVEILDRHLNDKSNVYFIGNGGSAAIASHMTADFFKSCGLSTVSLYDSPTLTCLGNDFCYEEIFSKQLEKHARADELLIAISSSGNSENIIRAIEVGKSKGMEIITFTGFLQYNKIRSMGNISVYVPSEEYGIVESIHNLILQQAVDELVKISQ